MMYFIVYIANYFKKTVYMPVIHNIYYHVNHWISSLYSFPKLSLFIYSFSCLHIFSLLYTACVLDRSHKYRPIPCILNIMNVLTWEIASKCKYWYIDLNTLLIFVKNQQMVTQG